MHNGYLRVAAVSPRVNVADVNYNVQQIANACHELKSKGVAVALFPELSVTGYTCGDLFHQRTLLDAAKSAIIRLADLSQQLDMAIVVGAPIEVGSELYNCAVVLCGGHVVAIVPKTYLPEYNEYNEKRWFVEADGSKETRHVKINDDVVAFGNNVLLSLGDIKMGIEICEDLWSPIPPSSHMALAGAQVILNLSASNDLIGKYDYLRDLIKQQSARCIAAYVYAGAGYGESSTDMVFDGKTLIAENGKLLEESVRWNTDTIYVISDIDIEAINRDRMHMRTFSDCAHKESARNYCCYSLPILSCESDDKLYRTINPHPFLPSDDACVDNCCEEIINIQVAGLVRRLEATNTRSLVVGVSGGLDSTLALLVATKAFDRLGYDRAGIVGVTMPGFGTTDRTYNNALTLMRTLGITMREISIVASVEQHFSDIGHDKHVHDVTYENSQARERTQLLMDIANQVVGMVLGTGDLSELALGWATYNGDHMSMYGINAGVPKTLVKYLVRWFALRSVEDDEREALNDVIETPISPELIPGDEQGNIQQKTEDLVGPYDLHDFVLYYVLRYGFAPSRIYFLARKAFVGVYDDSTIKHWMKVFYRRFFTQQFKRSCLPDGPKVGSVCLSPRGDWRMPSDASSDLWLKECETL